MALTALPEGVKIRKVSIYPENLNGQTPIVWEVQTGDINGTTTRLATYLAVEDDTSEEIHNALVEAAATALDL